MYRSPNCDVNYAVNLCTFLDWCNLPKLPLIVLGDFNFPNISWHTYHIPHEKMDLFSGKLSMNIGLSKRLRNLLVEKTF